MLSSSLICLHIASIVAFVFCIVYFVGYWVSANYYLKFSNDFKKIYVFQLGVSAFLCFFVVVPGLFVVGAKSLLLIGPLIGAISILFAVLFAVLFGLKHLYLGFHKSRKYFANKRNLKI